MKRAMSNGVININLDILLFINTHMDILKEFGWKTI